MLEAIWALKKKNTPKNGFNKCVQEQNPSLVFRLLMEPTEAPLLSVTSDAADFLRLMAHTFCKVAALCDSLERKKVAN